MPIANCIVSPRCYENAARSADLIQIWAHESGKSPDAMTVNIVLSTEQFGNPYDIMANLYLPSLWSKQDVALLQTGLAKALASYFEAPLNSVFVMTSILDSGQVVENGEQVVW